MAEEDTAAAAASAAGPLPAAVPAANGNKLILNF